MGFAVSFITLSREVSCDKLFHFYRRVAPIVHLPDSSVQGLEGRLLRKNSSDLAGSSIVQPSRYPHQRPAIVLRCLLKLGVVDEDGYSLYNDLLGNRLSSSEIRRLSRKAGIHELLRDLPGFRIGDHAQAYFGVWADAIRFCGYRGWVILIDEVELISRLGRASRLNAYMNLDWLLNWSDAMDFPIYTVGAAARSLQDVWFQGTERRRDDRSVIPEMAKEQFGEDAQGIMRGFFERAVGNHCPTIGPVEESDLSRLLERILKLHGLAHAWNPPDLDEIRSHFSEIRADAPVRTYIRALLEALDQTLITGQTPLIQPSELTEPSTEEDSTYFAEDETGEDETVPQQSA